MELDTRAGNTLLNVNHLQMNVDASVNRQDETTIQVTIFVFNYSLAIK